MKYTSTRDNSLSFSSSRCIIQGISRDGGLFVPEELPKFDYESFIEKSYSQIAQSILSEFLSDFSQEQIAYCVQNAYNENNFDTDEIFSLKHIGDVSYLELFHGRTLAFKDAALSILPYLMSCAKQNIGDETKTLILTATSGDTGKAAMEAFSGVENISVVVFYPHNGVSAFQLRQMLTPKHDNVAAVAVKGNFDDVQSAVKNIFSSREIAASFKQKGIRLSSANSINIGRLIPQIVYYYYSYVKLIENGIINKGDKINFSVPTGNFGNILAGYYAKKSGLPINKLICASNENNVLTDFFISGVYDINRPFYKTISPSMDILISSNLERLLYELDDKNTDKLKGQIAELNSLKLYCADKIKAAEDFCAYFATQKQTSELIKKVYAESGYLLDPHSAIAEYARRAYKSETGDKFHGVALCTASPFKFASSVLKALGDDEIPQDELSRINALASKTSLCIPKQTEEPFLRKMNAEKVVNVDGMYSSIFSSVKGLQ